MQSPDAACSSTPLRRVVSYVQRSQRLSPGQQRAWDELWDRYGLLVADLAPGPLDLPALFGRTAPVVLEIGPGMGEATAAMAAARPDLDHLAVEVYKPGLARLLGRIGDADLTNLRLLRGDAVVLLTDHIAPDSLDEVRIFFPDPWPKRKHHKRRLIQPAFVALVVSRLRPGGRLHLATDWAPYAEQMREVCDAEPGLRLDPSAGRGQRPVSKFEGRGFDEGRPSTDLGYDRLAP